MRQVKNLISLSSIRVEIQKIILITILLINKKEGVCASVCMSVMKRNNSAIYFLGQCSFIYFYSDYAMCWWHKTTLYMFGWHKTLVFCRGSPKWDETHNFSLHVERKGTIFNLFFVIMAIISVASKWSFRKFILQPRADNWTLLLHLESPIHLFTVWLALVSIWGVTIFCYEWLNR